MLGFNDEINSLICDDDKRRWHLKHAIEKVYNNSPMTPEMLRELVVHSEDMGESYEDGVNAYIAGQVLDQYKIHENDDYWNAPSYARDSKSNVGHLEYKAEVSNQLDDIQRCKDAGFFDDKRPDTFWKACEGRVVASFPLEIITYIKHTYGLDQSDPDFMKQIKRIAYFHDDRILRACLVGEM